MAGTTYRYLANLILDKINENADDSQITINHVIFWINIASNRLRLERKTKIKADSGAYLVLIEGVPITVAGRRKFIELPNVILDMDNDNGVAAINYNLNTAPDGVDTLGTKFERISPAAAHSAMHIPIRKPSPTNPFYYRMGDRLSILGLENVRVDTVDLFLYTAVDPTIMVSLDTEVGVEEDQIEPLYAAVMQLMNFGLPSSQSFKNDGKDNSLQTPSAALRQQYAQSQKQAQSDAEGQ